jgi:biotin transport system substrate-specific component
VQRELWYPTLQRELSYSTLGSAFFPKEEAWTWLRPLLLVATGVVALTLFSQLSWNLPFSHAKDGSIVPVTGQTFAVLLIGAWYGSRLAGATLFVWMSAGAAGVPVFADWSGTYTAFAGPTGGYIIGFFFTAVLVGWFAERGWDRSHWIVLPMVLGNALLYLPGLIWLNGWLHVTDVPGADWQMTRDLGLWPFIPGDLFKLVAAALAVPAGWTIADMLRGRDTKG